MTGQVTGGLNNVDIFPEIIPEDDRITFQESTAPVNRSPPKGAAGEPGPD